MPAHDQPSDEPVELTTSEVLREMFNAREYSRLAKTGQLLIRPIRESHLTYPEAKGMPRCTVGQFLRYLEPDGQWVAEVYQYLLPNGSLGASGLPDPKRLRIDGKVYSILR